MDRATRSRLIGGILLVLLGAWLLALQLYPTLGDLININFSWPLIIIGVGALLLVLGLLIGVPGMAIPASIVAGIGLILYYQNITGNWESWAYAWALIPGFVGIGLLLMALLGETPRQNFREGINLVVISAVLFVLFASFLGNQNLLGPYWPVLLILLGLWLVLRPLLRRR